MNVIQSIKQLNLQDQKFPSREINQRGSSYLTHPGHSIYYPHPKAGVILGMCSASERRRYSVTSSLTGWAHTQNDPCKVNSLP